MQQPTTTSDAVTAVTDIALYNIFASQQGNSKMNVPRPCLFLNADGGVCKVAAAHGAYGCHNHSESTHQNPSPFGKMLSEMARGQSLLLKDANVMNAFVALSKTVAAIGLPHLSSIPLAPLRLEQKVVPASAPMDFLALLVHAAQASQGQAHYTPSPTYAPTPQTPINPFINVPQVPVMANPFAYPQPPYAQPLYAQPGPFAQIPTVPLGQGYAPFSGQDTSGTGGSGGSGGKSKICGMPTKSGSKCKKPTGDGYDTCHLHAPY